MTKISINSNFRNDPFYRYQMNHIESNITNRGNGTFTTLNNLDKISNDLYTPNEILFKFISFDLGTSYNLKKKNLKGSYKSDKIQKSIDKYINYFVLCNKCSIPEVSPVVEGKKKKAKLIMNCVACGHSQVLSSKDKLYSKMIDCIIKDIQNGRKWKQHKTIFEQTDVLEFNF